MFSEKEIINQCRECREGCERLTMCPLKVRCDNRRRHSVRLAGSCRKSEKDCGDAHHDSRPGDCSLEELLRGLGVLHQEVHRHMQTTLIRSMFICPPDVK